MLDTLYENALENKNNIKENINALFKDIKIDPSLWIEYNITEMTNDLTIAAGDGSIKKKKFLAFIFYAIDAECLIYNPSHELKSVVTSEISITPHHKHVRDRLRNHMGIFEIKNALKSFKQENIDVLLFDGSILGNIIRPSPNPIKNKLSDPLKEKIKNEYVPLLEDDLNHLRYGISSTKFNQIEETFGIDAIIYLESLESLLVINKLLQYKEKVVAISKTSTRTDYFDSKIPDMVLFDKEFKKQGYSQPRYVKVSKSLKRDFPVCNDFFRSLTFTIFYVRLEEHKNILKFELPYKADEEDIKRILNILKGNSTEGYPYLLKKAHDDVVIHNKDMDHLLKMMGFLEKSGREML